MIELRGITKTFAQDGDAIPVLKGIDLHIKRKEFVAITGAPGSGKSTLMRILGCLDMPTTGEYLLGGLHTANCGQAQLAWERVRRIGYVYQHFHWISHASAWTNVAQPLVYRGIAQRHRYEMASDILERMGIGDRRDRLPRELSENQLLRLALARALVGRPHLLLVDDPTQELERYEAHHLVELLEQVMENGVTVTVVMVTRDFDIAARCHRQLRIHNGVIDDGARPAPQKTNGDTRWNI